MHYINNQNIDTMSLNPGKGYKTLRTSFESNIFEIALNRPSSFNAVNFLMIQELHDVLDMLSTCSYSKVDPFVDTTKSSPRVVLLTGLGRAFCVGVDLKEADSDPEWDFGGLHSQQLMSKVIEKLYYLPQIVISLIHGRLICFWRTGTSIDFGFTIEPCHSMELYCRTSCWARFGACSSIRHSDRITRMLI